MKFTRQQLVEVAQAAASTVGQRFPSLRVVVVVTDAEGEYVGVGSTTHDADAQAILWCAQNATDRVDHHVDLPGVER